MTARFAWREWAFALLLYAPIAVVYAAHFAAGWWESDRIGTGFIQYDQPSYMASAREYIDGSSSGLLYALPRERVPDAEPTLVQLHLWALSIVWRITGIDPGLLFVLFGAVFGVLAIRVFMALFDAVVIVKGGVRRWGQLLFVWGGGLLCLAGVAYGWMKGARGPGLAEYLFEIDPAFGWWFLNLGRNLIYPNEAYYHFMLFAALLLLARGRFWTAGAVTAMLAWSHPFAGVGLLAISITWSALERFYVRNRSIPLGFIVLLAAIAASCAWYFFIWVPAHANPELVGSIQLAWTLSAQAFIPAYALVALMTMANLRTPSRTLAFLGEPAHRLLAVMAVVNFMLENHEFAVEPHQPVHFARGYVWSALFLMGAPWLLTEALPWCRSRGRVAAATLTVVASAALLLDNALFFGTQVVRQLRATAQSVWLTPDGREALGALRQLHRSEELLVSQDLDLAHLAQVYTPYRTYAAHFFETRERSIYEPRQLAYFNQGELSDSLLTGPLMVVAMTDSGAFTPPGRARLVYANPSYRLFRVEAVR